jgi:hypothetical protein
MTASCTARSPKTYPVAVRGEGVRIWDSTGKEFAKGSPLLPFTFRATLSD